MSENGVEPRPVPRMKERYQQEIVPALMKEFGYSNVMQAPRFTKICRQHWPGRSADQQPSD